MKNLVTVVLCLVLFAPLSVANYGDVNPCPSDVTIRDQLVETDTQNRNYADFYPINSTYILVGDDSEMVVTAYIFGTPNCFELCRTSGTDPIKYCQVPGALHITTITTESRFVLLVLCQDLPC